MICAALLTAAVFGFSVTSDARAELTEIFAPTDQPLWTTDRQFLAELRERGLFQLGQKYCEQLLARPDLSEARQADMTIELAHLLAQWAGASPPESRAPLWKRAFDLPRTFIEQNPDHPRLILVRMQEAMNHSLRGRQAYLESQLLAQRDAARTIARDELLLAIRQFRVLDTEVTEELNRLSSQRPYHRPTTPAPTTGGRQPAEPLSQYEISGLQKNIKYELALALRDRAACFPSDSADHYGALAEAVKLFDELSGLDGTHPLAWKSRLAKIECARMLGDDALAGRLLAALAASSPPPRVALHARAMKIRFALEDGQIEGALEILKQGRQVGSTMAGELDFEWLRTYLAAWNRADQARDQVTAGQWEEKITKMMEWIDRNHGPYWSRRAELLLQSSIGENSTTANLEMIVRKAEGAYRSKEYDRALEAYDQATKIALGRGDSNEAYRLAMVAATIQHFRNEHADAAERFSRLTLAMPDDERSPRGYRLAIHHTLKQAETATDRATQTAILDRVESMLRGYLSQWPNQPDLQNVRVQLARFLQYRKKWSDAAAVWAQIVTPQLVQAPVQAETMADTDATTGQLRTAIACYQRWIDETREASGVGETDDDPATVVELRRSAAQWLASLLKSGMIGPAKWTPAMRETVVEAARLLLLNEAEEDVRLATKLLDRANREATDAPADWKATAGAMSVYCLAQQGRFGEATSRMETLAGGRSEDLLVLVDRLTEVAHSADPTLQGRLAGLQLRAIELLESRDDTNLTRTDRMRLESARRAAAGSQREADARALARSSSTMDMRRALKAWREVKDGSKPGTQAWFRASLSIVQLHARLGNKDQARTIITQIRLLHPELGGPVIKRKFEAVLGE